MAPSRAFFHPTSDTSDDNDAAPESVTLTQSRADVKRLNEARQAAESDAKHKRKEKNRLKDGYLKKRAWETRGISATRLHNAEKTERPSGKGKEPENDGEDEGRRNLEDRMERAMRDAQDEENGEGEAWGAFGSGSEVEDDFGSRLGRGSDDSGSTSEEEGNELESTEGDSDPMDGVEEEESSESPLNTRLLKEPNLDYLPEHLFAEALSKIQIPSKQETPSTKRPLKFRPKQKRKSVKKRKAKDIILGSKTVRTVAAKTTHISSAASRTLPPGKVKRFYEDHLSLKSKRSGKTHGGWERKAANVGVLRSSTLPAANFVRNS